MPALPFFNLKLLMFKFSCYFLGVFIMKSYSTVFIYRVLFYFYCSAYDRLLFKLVLIAQTFIYEKFLAVH